MQLSSRPYEPGDEVAINRLYLSIAGRDRTPEEFAWEWLDTWDGRGTMDLLFDLDREEGDELVAQYSLIPTPLSLWGRPVLAGKTENCMCHPDYRRSGLYTSHEREWFEKEKERYSFFFTTAGQVTGGAVGRVRTKLGYVAFDDWANYTVWLSPARLREDLRAIVTSTGRAGERLAPSLSGLLTPALRLYSRARRRSRCAYRVAFYGRNDAPLEQVARLWERNRGIYGISVDRSAAYLRWRVSRDPHLEHEYLAMYGEGGLLGYAAYFVQAGDLHIVDILADGARPELFRHLLAALVRRGGERGVSRVQCLALRHSALLPRRLRSAGFFDTAALSPASYVRRPVPHQFFLYVPEDLRDDPRITDPADWYVTELVLEGLPRPTARS